MSGMKRSKLVQFQIAVGRFFSKLGGLFRPKWLRGFNRSIRKGFIRLQKLLLGIIAPKWLRKTSRNVQKGLMKAEATVARTGQQVGATVAKSAVGTSAKKLSRFGRILEWRVFSTFGYIGKIFAGLIPAPVRRGFALFGQAFWRVFGVFFVFIGRWFRTRHYWHLVGGIPAFILALPLAYCMARMPFYSAAKKAVHYRRAAQNALMSDDHQAANLYYRKLHQLGAMNEVAEYQAATSTYLAGDTSKAFELMKKLAPDDEPGFPPAHVWIARWYFDGRSELESDQAEREGEKHLALALERDPNNPDGRALQALRKAETGDFNEAVAELRRIVQEVPQQGVALAQLYARQGRWEQARVEIDRVLNAYRQKEEAGTELMPQDYIVWAYAHTILGERDKATEALARGYELHSGNRDLREEYYRKLLDTATNNYRARSADPQSIVEALKTAWKVDPDAGNAPMVLLGRMSNGKDEFGLAARNAALELLESDNPPAPLFRVMGPILATEGDLKLGIQYLRKAVELDPMDSYSLNNLAHCLLTQGTAYEDALQLTDRALKLEPDQALYRETRGQALMKLGKFEQAAEELRFALNGLGDLPEIHAALAECYEKLGQAEQAAIHRRKAN